LDTNPDIKFPLISLYGTDYINNDWTKECMRSWQNITNIQNNHTYILPEKTPGKSENEFFRQLEFNVLDGLKTEQFLKNYPALQEIRKRDVTWRKILDPAILFPEATAITLIDTDVYIRNKVNLPLLDFDIIYMREDIPAYRSNWKVAWKFPMVPALNAGIIIVKPDLIDFDFLEALVGKYILNCKNLWWSEQTAWSCLAGKTEKRGVFDGKTVRVTSAMKLRKPQEMIQNKYKYFGGNKMIKEYSEFKPYLIDGSIFHFAGPGKYMFKDSLNYLKSATSRKPVDIKAYPEKTLSFTDKVFISSRLFLKELI